MAAHNKPDAFHDIVVNSADGVVIVDETGKVLFMNPAAEQLFGRLSGEMVGEPFGFPLAPGEVASIDIIRDGAESVVAEIRTVKTMWNGRSALLASLRDVTERRRMEERLQESEAGIRKLFETLLEGLVIVDSGGTIMQANPAALRLLGIKRSELGKCRYNDARFKLLKPDGSPIPLEERSITLALKKGQTRRDVVAGLADATGSVRWLRGSTTPLVAESGEIIGAATVYIDITEQKRMSDELQFYVAESTRVQEEERKRIARELHDGIGQSLAGLCLELDAIARDLEKDPTKSRRLLTELRGTAEGIVRDLRIFSHQLRPGTLDHLSLSAALGSLLLEIIGGEMQTGCQVTGNERRLPAETELALFRITQEALNNIRKHSGASRVELSLDYSPRKVRLTIEDNGCGFALPEEGNFALLGRLGLVSMKERARLIGAKLRIATAPGSGTRITVDVTAANKIHP